MDDRSPVIASFAYFDVISPALIVFVFCRFVWVWKIIVIWKCDPERQSIASLDCDGHPLEHELCLEWFWVDRGNSLSDVVSEFDCFRVPETSCFQSELNKILSNTQMVVFFVCFWTSHLVSRCPCIRSIITQGRERWMASCWPLQQPRSGSRAVYIKINAKNWEMNGLLLMLATTSFWKQSGVHDRRFHSLAESIELIETALITAACITVSHTSSLSLCFVLCSSQQCDPTRSSSHTTC